MIIVKVNSILLHKTLPLIWLVMARNNNSDKANDDKIICCACMDMFSEYHVPRILDCSHSIGEECVRLLLKQSEQS